MLAAGGLKIYKELSHATVGSSENWGMVVLGFVTAAVVSFIAVKWLLRYVQTHTFTVFGWYRIGLAAVIVLLLAASPPAERPQAGRGTNVLNPASLPK